jgi:hypothetical protein
MKKKENEKERNEFFQRVLSPRFLLFVSDLAFCIEQKSEVVINI